MNIEDIKKILETSPSVAFVENGVPTFVVTRYDDFTKGVKVEEPTFGGLEPIQKKLSEKETEIIERINKDILALKQEIAEQEKEVEAID